MASPSLFHSSMRPRLFKSPLPLSGFGFCDQPREIGAHSLPEVWLPKNELRYGLLGSLPVEPSNFSAKGASFLPPSQTVYYGQDIGLSFGHDGVHVSPPPPRKTSQAPSPAVCLVSVVTNFTQLAEAESRLAPLQGPTLPHAGNSS